MSTGSAEGMGRGDLEMACAESLIVVERVSAWALRGGADTSDAAGCHEREAAWR